MKLVFIRTKIDSTIFDAAALGNGTHEPDAFARLKINAKAGSSSKNIIAGLKSLSLISASEEWKFWHGTEVKIADLAETPVKFFPIDQTLVSKSLAVYIREQGEPDIIWVEGRDFPPYIQQILDLCPNSFKMIYSKDWRPWKIAGLQHYDLCLVDEEWERLKVTAAFPHVSCGIWDKLIDYEETFRPLSCQKIYDLCYVAYLRSRKNHELLFRAMAACDRKHLSCVCVGADRRGYRHELQKLANDLQIDVHFVGEVAQSAVNRYINESRIGVMCSERDAVPRAILEYMAADVPVLVNAELQAGKRYVLPEAGQVRSPEEFHLGIRDILADYERYSPRACYLANYSFDRVMKTFVAVLAAADRKFCCWRDVLNATGGQQEYSK